MKRCIFKCFDLHMSFCTLVFFTLHHLHRSKTPRLVHILKRREREVDLRAPSQDFPGARVAKTLISKPGTWVTSLVRELYHRATIKTASPPKSKYNFFFFKECLLSSYPTYRVHKDFFIYLEKMYLTKASISIQKLSIHPHPTRE